MDFTNYYKKNQMDNKKVKEIVPVKTALVIKTHEKKTIQAQMLDHILGNSEQSISIPHWNFINNSQLY